MLEAKELNRGMPLLTFPMPAPLTTLPAPRPR